MKDDTAFPERVEYKSCTATIYLQRNRKAVRYEVKYYDLDGSRQRLTFPTYSSAKKFAETALKEIKLLIGAVGWANLKWSAIKRPHEAAWFRSHPC